MALALAANVDGHCSNEWAICRYTHTHHATVNQVIGVRSVDNTHLLPSFTLYHFSRGFRHKRRFSNQHFMPTAETTILRKNFALYYVCLFRLPRFLFFSFFFEIALSTPTGGVNDALMASNFRFDHPTNYWNFLIYFTKSGAHQKWPFILVIPSADDTDSYGECIGQRTRRNEAKKSFLITSGDRRYQ